MIIYNLLVRLYGLLIRIASLKNKKAAQWIHGRSSWRKTLSEKISKTKNKRVWVHCASYGEFEQGRPVMEAIKKTHPDHSIVLSFFSPSGYEAFHSWSGADVVCYLPLDTRANARDFIEIVQPKTVIFIKYEFWINFLFQLKKKNVPTFLVSAVFKPHHPFFKWYGGIFRRSLLTFTRLFIQDEPSGKLLAGIGINNYEVSGDTRFDRVLEIKSHAERSPALQQFKGNAKLIIAGSTWPKDESLLLSAFEGLKENNTKLVLVPHNVDERSIKETIERIEKQGLSYSLYSGGANAATPVLVIDVMGILSRSYFYADCAYVGGGFNGGLHNVLEAVVYNIPVAFYGSDYVKYNEAVDLLRLGAAANVNTAEELRTAFDAFLNNAALRKEIAEKLHVFFEKNSNSTATVLESMGF